MLNRNIVVHCAMVFDKEIAVYVYEKLRHILYTLAYIPNPVYSNSLHVPASWNHPKFWSVASALGPPCKIKGHYY